jgi:hypothetical protein
MRAVLLFQVQKSNLDADMLADMSGQIILAGSLAYYCIKYSANQFLKIHIRDPLTTDPSFKNLT